MISAMIDGMGTPELAIVLLLMKVTIVVGLACLIAVGMKKSSAGSRHMLWAGAVIALLALPVLTVALPRLELPLVGPGFEGAMAPSSDGTVVVADPEVTPEGAAPGVVVPSDAAPEGGRVAAPLLAPVEVPSRRIDWFGWLVGIWALGTAVLLMRIFAGWWGLRGFAREAEEVADPEWLQLLRDVAWLLEVRRPVTLLKSATASMPVTWGTRAPVVMLPADADGWSAERRRVVLLHEVAHVARYDCLTQMLASITTALYWVHPLAWVAARRLRVERERACDDRVLEAGERASEYAGHLLEVARSFRPAAPVGIAAIAMARPSQLEGRLLAVLDGARRRGTPGPGARAAGLLAAALVLFPLAAAHAVAAAEDPTADGPIIDEAGAAAAADNAAGRWSGTRSGGDAEVDVPLGAADSILEMRIAATPGATVTVELATGGRLSLVGWDQDEVFVRGELDGNNLDEVEVRLERSGDGVRLVSRYTTERRDRRANHAFEVFVPARSDLQLHSGGGDVAVRSVTGSLSGSTGGGALALANTTGRASLRTGGGNIRVADSDLEGEVTTGGGNVRFTDVRGGIQARTGGGNISVEDGPSRLSDAPASQAARSFVTGGGNIDLGLARSPLELETGGGAIRIGSAHAPVRAETGGGTIRVGDVTGGIDATTGSGEIAIRRSAGPVRARTGSGAIHVGVAAQAAYSDIDIGTGNGSITLVLPDDFSGSFDVQASPRGGNGAIVSDFPITTTGGGRATGSVGSARNVVRIRAQNGTVRIQRGGTEVAMNGGTEAPGTAPDLRFNPGPASSPSPHPHVDVDVDLDQLEEQLQHIETEVEMALDEHVDIEMDSENISEIVRELSSVAAAQTAVAVTSAVRTGLTAALEAFQDLDPASWGEEN